MDAEVTSRPQSEKHSTSSFSASQASISRPTSRAGSKHGKRAPGSANSRPTTGLNSVPPEYLRPVVKSAVRRWKKMHEQTMIERLIQNKEERRINEKKEREEAHKIARRIPVDLLAREWLNLERATIETRAYLIDNILPYVTLGLEQLLKTVMQRGLAEKETADPNFNPINFLGQYLMRNNPRYSNFSEASPYIRGLRRVNEELRQEMFQLNDNKLAKLKAAAKRKREEKEQQEHKEKLEVKRRKDEVQELFDEFLVADNVRVDLATLQSAVKSFTEIAEHFPDDVKKHLLIIFEIEITQDDTRKLSRKEFSEYIDPFIEDMPGQVFEQFCIHLRRCAMAYKAAIDKEDRKNILTNLFVSCDHDEIGLLDRQRILALFDKFFAQATGDIKNMLRDPTKWPVREVEEELRTYPAVPPPIHLDEEEPMEEESETEEDKEEKASSPVDQATEVDDEGKEETETAPAVGEGKNESEEETKEEMTADSEGETKEAPTEEEKAPAEEGEVDGAAKTGTDETSKIEETEPTLGNKNQSANAEEDTVTEDKVQTAAAETAKALDAPGTEEGKPSAEVEALQAPAESQAAVEEKGSVDEAEKEKHEEKNAGEEKEAAVDSKENVKDDSMDQSKEEEMGEVKTEDQKQSTGEVSGDAANDKKDVEQSGADAAESKPTTESANVERLALDSARPVTSVHFAEGTEFEREKTGLSSRSLETARSQSSAFDEQNLDVTQFVQVTETFLGDNPEKNVLTDLVQFIRDGYQETEEERMTRLMKAHRQAMSAKRKRLIDVLFEKWDNDGSGYLEMDELEAAILKYKEGSYKKAINSSKRDLRQKARFHDNRLTKREFRQFLYAVCRHFGDEDGLEFLIEFLIQSVERSYAERIRGDARKKWLTQIVLSAETGGASMEPVYRAVFQALYKDAEAHGEGKRISANIAMLEGNDVMPDRGNMLLRYVAATPDDAPFMIGRILFKDSKCVSFQAVESGKPIHVPRVSTSPNIIFFNPDRKEEDKEGSLIVVPLKDQKKRVFGTMGIDTLNDPQAKSIFITHEIQFFQGIAKSFSIAYHYVDVQRKTLRVAESALSWICRRSPSVRNVTYYMKEPDGKADNYVLRRMLYTDERGDTTNYANPPRLERRDNLFRDYLFKAIDTSESISSDAYGERHLAIPLRDLEGHAVAVVDIGIGDLKVLPTSENKEVMKMLKLLQMAYSEISKASQGEESSLDGGDLPSNAEMMFDKLMLVDLRENVAHLDAQAYSELRSYTTPPKTVHNILQAVLSIFYPDKAKTGDFGNWDKCKKFVNIGLSKKILNYEPQSNAESAPLQLIMGYLNAARAEVPHNMVEKHGSKPARYLYNWVFVCVSLIEHTRKMRENKKQDTLPPVPEEAEEPPHE